MNIFQNPTKSIPKKDEQIVRVPFEQQEIGARSTHLPKDIKSGQMSVQHVPNKG